MTNSHVDNRNDDEYNCIDGRDFGGFDIMWFTAYTVQACVDACSTYNAANITNAPCKGVTMASDLSRQYYINGAANCWLKSEANEEGSSGKTNNSFMWLKNQR